MVLLGNKVDLGENSRKISKSEGEKFAKENKMKFFEVSAKENTNIKEFFMHSTADLPFFDQFRNSADKDNKILIEELLYENGGDISGLGHGHGHGDTSRINISVSPDMFTDDKKCKC